MKKLTIALVSCASKKLAAPAKAAELYTSDLFRKSRTFAERNADRWLVLSAAHGVVAPTTELAPYDVTLSKMKAAEVRAWGAKVAEQLAVEVVGMAHDAGVSLADVELVILAGEKYSAFRVGFEKRLPTVRVSAPLAGLEIGERLAYLKRANEAVAANPVVAAREATAVARDAFDAACYRRATLRLAPGYGVDAAKDEAEQLAADEAIEVARVAFREAHAVLATELRRSMGVEVAGVELNRVVHEAALAADALPVPVAPITPEIEREAFDSIVDEVARLDQLEDGYLEARHLELRGKRHPIGTHGSMIGAIAYSLQRRAALALVSEGPRERLARAQEQLGRAYARKEAALAVYVAPGAGWCEELVELATAIVEVNRAEAASQRENELLFAPSPELAAQLAAERSRYVEPSSSSISHAELALGA